MKNQQVCLTRTQARVLSAIISLINKKGFNAVKEWDNVSKKDIKCLVENPGEFLTLKGELWTFLDSLKNERLYGDAIEISYVADKSHSSMIQLQKWTPQILKQ